MMWADKYLFQETDQVIVLGDNGHVAEDTGHRQPQHVSKG